MDIKPCPPPLQMEPIRANSGQEPDTDAITQRA